MFQDAFPEVLRGDVNKVIELIPFKTYNNISVGTTEQAIQYTLNYTELRFPYRLYFIEATDDILSKLNLQQEMILHCIYTRSCDGFVRQKHLKSLLLMDYTDWAIPYIVKLCDEYVIEILEMAYGFLKEQDTTRIKRFCLENDQSLHKSYARMVSYWNEYYRHKYNNFHQYVGKKIFRECFGYSKIFESKKEFIVF